MPGLTPGDFVRSMKQLIDLLDQVAVASRPDTTARPAGSARGGAAGGRGKPGDGEQGDGEPGDERAP